MSKKVALMCGHGKQTDGKWDPGTTYAGYTEAALMLPITKSAVKYLRSYGVTVISDADKDNNKNMIADVKWANKEKADIYVSIHCDYSKAPTGVMPLYVSAKGKKLASALNSSIKTGMSMKSRGVCKRTDLYELNYTDMPACILETGSIKADLKLLKNDYDKYGKFIARGICNYLGIEPKEKKAKTTAATAAATATTAGTTATQTTSAEKLIAKAKALAWPKGTKSAKYKWKGGSATEAFTKALRRVFTTKERSKWGTAAKKGCSCDVFVATCVRDAGLDDKYPRGLKEQYSYKPKNFTRKVYKNKKPVDVAKKNSVIIYAKNKNKTKGHTCIYGNNNLYQANHEVYYGHYTGKKGTEKKLKTKRPYVIVLTPKK